MKKLVVESLDEFFESKKEDKAKPVSVDKTKNKLEKTKLVKVSQDIKEKIAALKKVEKELEGKLQKTPGPISKKKIQSELDTIKGKIAAWNKKL